MLVHWIPTFTFMSPMPPPPRPKCTSSRKPRASSTPSACPPTGFSRVASPTCSSARRQATERRAALLCKLQHQAGTWKTTRQVVSKAEWHPGELYPRVGFIVTNLSRTSARVVAFYNQRGSGEQHMKEC